MHQNRASPFARRGNRRELRSEDHFYPSSSQKNRGSLAIFFAEEITHLGASKSRAIFPGAVTIAAATAENRATLVHSALNKSGKSLSADPFCKYPKIGYLVYQNADRGDRRGWFPCQYYRGKNLGHSDLEALKRTRVQN